MQKFGIEIRKVGTMPNLFKEVDEALRRMPEAAIQSQTVAHALQKMFQIENHFSVCTIQNCAEVCQVCISTERMRIYKAAHCMNWGDMMPDYRTTLCAMVLDDFRYVLNPSETARQETNHHPERK